MITSDNTTTVNILSAQAKEVRKELLKMIYTAKSGHPGGSLSAADIMTVLYFHEMNIDPKNPGWDDRDRFILSKGHTCPVLYTCLGLKGYFDREIMGTLRSHGSILQGHPDMNKCPGVDMSTGSLGQGLSAAVGMALRGKRDNMDYRVIVLLGDGECNEGQIWEAVQTAVKYELNNLIILVDNNGLQNDGTCNDIMPGGDLVEKFSAFGCRTLGIDGHCIYEIMDALALTRNPENLTPFCIVCRTVKGKGVSFMENIVSWHGTPPDDEQFLRAIYEIEEGV